MYMGWSESELLCRKHLDENPQPGVCPSCLRERLSTISANFSSSSSPVYYYYSSVTSPAVSSPTTRRRHQRVASDIMDSIYLAMSGNNGLRKSRSIAFASKNNNGVIMRDGVVNNGKKKGGFWNKLMFRSSSKKAKF